MSILTNQSDAKPYYEEGNMRLCHILDAMPRHFLHVSLAIPTCKS